MSDPDHSQHYTDEDEEDRCQRGLCGDHDSRSLQFIAHSADTDDLRGQFRRSRNDGVLGRRGRIEEIRAMDLRRGE
jgi:hypothetical protein